MHQSVTLLHRSVFTSCRTSNSPQALCGRASLFPHSLDFHPDTSCSVLYSRAPLNAFVASSPSEKTKSRSGEEFFRHLYFVGSHWTVVEVFQPREAADDVIPGQEVCGEEKEGKMGWRGGEERGGELIITIKG